MTVIWVPDLGYSSLAVPLRESVFFRGGKKGGVKVVQKKKATIPPPPTKRVASLQSHVG